MNIGLNGKKEIAVLVFKDYVVRYMVMKPGHIGSIRAYGEYYLPENVIDDGKIKDKETLRSILEDCVKNWGLKKKEVYFLAPDSTVVVRQMQIPNISDQEIKGHIYMEIGGSIHLPMENPIFEVEVLEIKDDQKEILLFAAPEQVILDYSNLLEDIKLIPIVCDLSPLAIYRLYFEHNQVKEEDHSLAVQFDIQSLTLGIFKEHKLIFMRHMKMDTDIKAWKTPQDDEGILYLKWNGDEEYLNQEIQEMLIEIERVMSYYRFNLSQGNSEITNVLLYGDHPNLTEIKNRFQDMTDQPVITFKEQSFKTISDNNIPRRHHLSIGLGLKEVK